MSETVSHGVQAHIRIDCSDGPKDAFGAHRDGSTFGYRLLADELELAGHISSERRVWRIYSQQRIWSAFAKKRGLARKAGPPVHDYLVKREFIADGLDQL